MSQINVDTIRNSSGTGGELSLTGGDFSFDSNTLFIDSSADRVGVGTGTPGAPLDVRASGGVMLMSAPLMEGINIVAGEVNATTNVDLLTSSVHLFTTAGTANWTHNLRGDASTALNAILEVGQVCVVTVIATLGGSSGFTAGLSVDGASQSVVWAGGAAPTAASDTTGYDLYQFTVIKTGNGTYSVFGSTVGYQ